MIAVVVFVVVGVAAATYLAGLPRPDIPRIHRSEFERVTDVGSMITCAVCGAAPLTMLSVAYTGHARLPVLLCLVVSPAYFVIACLGVILPDIGRRAWTGFLSGVVAVLVYDMVRLALSYSQGGGDPIPHIGAMLMGHPAPWWLGYVWRTFGNGAGLGVTYVMLCPRGWWGPRTGLVYGSVVGLGMIGFLAAFPQAQDQLFRLTWQTVVNGFIGHWTYGAVLGSMARSARRRQDSPTRTREELRAQWNGSAQKTTRGRHAKRRRFDPADWKRDIPSTRPRTDEPEETREMWPVQDTPGRGMPRHPDRMP